MTPPATPNFDRIARPYRWLEYLTFGPFLQRTRLHFLPHLLCYHHALILGDGDGRFLAELLRHNPTMQVDAIDGSGTMLHLLRHRALAASGTVGSRLRTHRQDARTFQPTIAYDLVVTHFFLDCLTQGELERLVHRLAGSLRPGSCWLVSEFRIPSGLLRGPARLLIRLLYVAFRVLTGLRASKLPDHASALSAAGLVCIGRKHRLAGILAAELWQMSVTSGNI